MRRVRITGSAERRLTPKAEKAYDALADLEEALSKELGRVPSGMDMDDDMMLAEISSNLRYAMQEVKKAGSEMKSYMRKAGVDVFL